MGAGEVRLMPGVMMPKLDRRTFLLSSAMGLAAVFTHRPAAGAEDAFHLALLSDTHIPADRENEYRGFKPWANLQRIVPDVVAANPEGVIINGDAARLIGTKEDYVELAALLEPIAAETPVYVGLGNHDDRANFYDVISARPGDVQEIRGKHVTVVDHPVVRAIVLDSLLYVDKVAGLLGKAQREWLAAYLAEHTDKPTVFFIHHTLGDNDSDLLDTGRLFELLAPHSHVKAIFYGHSHVWKITERQGIQLINLPAVGYNFSNNQPVGWVDARFHGSGVELTLHAFGGNTEGDGTVTNVPWS
jgi:3',5'-cyclic-AMP phosphodiesterase